MSEEVEVQEQAATNTGAPVLCGSCAGPTHLVTYFGVQFYECDDVEGCGWMIPV